MANRVNYKYSRTEAAIEGVQASADDLKLLSGGWCLKIEIVLRKLQVITFINLYNT